MHHLLSRLSGFSHDWIYELIRHQELRLCLDVGAASGAATRRIIEAGDDRTRVIAFEPFPGNLPYFRASVGELDNVELVDKAVSDRVGRAQLRVDSVVTGEEPGWEGMSGYSSVGSLVQGTGTWGRLSRLTLPQLTLIARARVGRLRSRIRSWPRRRDAGSPPERRELSVETVTIDSVVDEHVDFMKVDVQGAELAVLRGSEGTIRRHGIDTIYLEFSGDRRILAFLAERGYEVFDTDYLIVPPNSDPGLVDRLDVEAVEPSQLSTGRPAFFARRSTTGGDACRLFDEVRAQGGYLQTDLICVRRDRLDAFIAGVARSIEPGVARKSP